MVLALENLGFDSETKEIHVVTVAALLKKSGLGPETKKILFDEVVVFFSKSLDSSWIE